MSKIKIGNNILDLALFTKIEILPTKISFHIQKSSGDCFCYERGIGELTTAEFDTLSAWLLNVQNNPYTVII